MSDKRKGVAESDDDLSEVDARRRFLRNCAKFASGTPPAVALLMSSSRPALADNPNCTGGSDQPPGCSDRGDDGGGGQ